jgi:isopenicillin N synthase-like dioxygenase
MGVVTKPLSESVPIIDLTEVLVALKQATSNGIPLNSPAVGKIVKEVRNACIQWGFFYVIGHGVDSELLGDLRKVSLDFFHKPKDFKNVIRRQANNYRGYTDSELTKQKLDLKEAFDFGFEHEDEHIKNKMDGGRNQWPADMPEFRSTLQKYSTVMHSLSSILMDLIFTSLGTDPSTMRPHFHENCVTSWCRLNYYPPCINTEGLLGVGPHSDPGTLTVLLQDDNVSSLQVEKDGAYHDVSPVKDSFVINIGDMMQVWSNGLYNAPVHRVVANPAKERFSVPFFFNPSYSTDVKPLPQCVSNDKPLRYRPLNWGDFIQERMLGNYADYGEEIQTYHYEIK